VNDEIKVGLSVSTSGRFELQGRQALNGVLLWQSFANSHGGIALRNVSPPIRIIWYDDEGKVGRVQENVVQLLRNDCIDILIGPYSSHLTIAAAEIAEEQKKLLWNYGGTSDEIFTRGWQSIIGISTAASDYFRALPRWLAKRNPELRQICVLYSAKGTFGAQVNRGVIESARGTDHSVHSLAINTPVGNSDAALAMLRGISPEAIVLASSFEDELAIMRSRSRWPTTVRAVAAVSAGTASFGSELGKMSDGVIGPSQWEPDMNFPSIVGPFSDWFVRAFQKEFGTAPGYVAAGAFAAGLILSECIRRAVSLDNNKLRDVASHFDINTFYGRFRIDPESGKQVWHRVQLVRWQNGARSVLPA
jgi:branched-chain amino acid transport system substrate-binding protein